jgi:hypothetical protein
MRIISFILAAMFVLFAFVQVNDPDPIVWILIYGVMAVICILAAFNIYPRKIMIGLALLYAVYSVYYFPGVREWLHQEDKSLLFDNLAKMQYSYIEESREFLGLAICVIVLVIYIVRGKRS